MSNVKQVEIKGTLPFTCTEDDEFALMLGRLQCPTLGIKWEWTEQAGFGPVNEHGGKTALYNFSLTGREAISWGYLDSIVEKLQKAQAVIESARARDVEDGGRWADLTKRSMNV